MKQGKWLIILIPILFILFLGGCVQPNQPNGNDNGNPNNGGGSVPSAQGEWVAYSPVQANTNPWQILDIPFINEYTEEEQARAWLSSIQAPYEELFFIPTERMVCQSLNCPRGDYLLSKPTNLESKQKMKEKGFSEFNEPFVYIKKTGENTFTVILNNPTEEALYYGGCNEFTPQRITDEGVVSEPEKQCVWEGTPLVLDSKHSISFTGETKQIGTYRVTILYGMGCLENKPLSQASCVTNGVLYSNKIESGKKENDLIVMRYDTKQCNSNPWQVGQITGTDENNGDENTVIISSAQQKDWEAFQNWVQSQNLYPLSISFIPKAQNKIVCESCACPTGEQYQIVISSQFQKEAEEKGFVYFSPYTPLNPIPSFSYFEWFVYHPYNCGNNSWPSPKQTVKSIETDMQYMKKWLEEKEITVASLALIKGADLSIKCTDRTNNIYGIGINDEESLQKINDLGFIEAGNQQKTIFTDTTQTNPIQLLYESKFCSPLPWKKPELTRGNEEQTAESVIQWMAEMGISLYDISIHETPVSTTGSCDTTSGTGVFVSVPEWSEPHLGVYGFLRPYSTFSETENKLYP